jgi:hypothetical protein
MELKALFFFLRWGSYKFKGTIIVHSKRNLFSDTYRIALNYRAFQIVENK